MPPPPPAPWRALAHRPAAPTSIPAPRSAAPFHTTRALAFLDDDVIIPPESPNFFSLPALPQSDQTKLPPIKGSLPVPRKIFSKRAHGAHKISPTFVHDTAPHSQAELAGEPPKSEKDAWKRLMAESRRTALGAGVASLWRRKVTRDGKAVARSRAKQESHRAAGFAPERADDVHTRGTVAPATLVTKVERDPLYAERQRASALKTAAITAAKSEARKDAIQRLYVEAASFIVTEAELATRVDSIFTEDYFVKPAKGRAHWNLTARNVWHAHGPPVKVRDMFDELAGRVTESSRAYQPESFKTLKRQKIVAGELTGGALSVLLPTDKEKSSLV